MHIQPFNSPPTPYPNNPQGALELCPFLRSYSKGTVEAFMQKYANMPILI
jgi:hypothetical protein